MTSGSSEPILRRPIPVHHPDTSLWSLSPQSLCWPTLTQVRLSSTKHRPVPSTMRPIKTLGGRDDSESIKVTRAGRKIKIKIRRSAMKIAEATARPKYCPIPRTHFKLSKTALPVGTPDHLEKAKAAFASSVSSSAQASYTSAYNHLLKAEAQLGRRFSSPPQEYEISYFTTECL